MTLRAPNNRHYGKRLSFPLFDVITVTPLPPSVSNMALSCSNLCSHLSLIRLCGLRTNIINNVVYSPHASGHSRYVYDPFWLIYTRLVILFYLLSHRTSAKLTPHLTISTVVTELTGAFKISPWHLHDFYISNSEINMYLLFVFKETRAGYFLRCSCLMINAGDAPWWGVYLKIMFTSASITGFPCVETIHHPK